VVDVPVNHSYFDVGIPDALDLVDKLHHIVQKTESLDRLFTSSVMPRRPDVGERPVEILRTIWRLEGVSQLL